MRCSGYYFALMRKTRIKDAHKRKPEHKGIRFILPPKRLDIPIVKLFKGILVINVITE